MSRGQEAAPRLQVFVEAGRKRTFARVSDWPGWSRSGRDESEALQAVLASGPRYAKVVHLVGLDVRPPVDVGQSFVSERVRGTATTDFGAPDSPLAGDVQALRPEELRRAVWVLTSCFRAFESAQQAGEGRVLSTGPRGGGRALPAILEHVLQGNRAYLQKLAWRPPRAVVPPLLQMRMLEAEILDALAAAVEGRLPVAGPRGGKLWTPRFFVRRVAWHLLDHAWEIEDRIE
jgi:hypothetical protein